MKPDAVRDNFIQSVVDLRRGIDVLRARADVVPNRIAGRQDVRVPIGANRQRSTDGSRRSSGTAGVPSERTIMMESDDPDFVNARKATPPEEFETQNCWPPRRHQLCADATRTPLLFQLAIKQYFNEAAMQRYVRAQRNPSSLDGMTLSDTA